MFVTKYSGRDAIAIRFEEEPDELRPKPDRINHVFSFGICRDELMISTQSENNECHSTLCSVKNDINFGPIDCPLDIQIVLDGSGKLCGVVVRNVKYTVSNPASLESVSWNQAVMEENR